MHRWGTVLAYQGFTKGRPLWRQSIYFAFTLLRWESTVLAAEEVLPSKPCHRLAARDPTKLVYDSLRREGAKLPALTSAPAMTVHRVLKTFPKQCVIVELSRA